MSDESRRQTKIVVAFLIIALAAVSPLVFPHRDGDAPQASQLPLGIAPSGHDSDSVAASQHDGAGVELQHIIDHTCVFTCRHPADGHIPEHAPAP